MPPPSCASKSEISQLAREIGEGEREAYQGEGAPDASTDQLVDQKAKTTEREAMVRNPLVKRTL